MSLVSISSIITAARSVSSLYGDGSGCLVNVFSPDLPATLVYSDQDAAQSFHRNVTTEK